MLMLIDIGANLSHASFQSDLESVIERAQSAGVTGIIVTGSSVVASEAAAKLSEVYPGLLFGTVGVHPHEAESFTPETAAALKVLAERSGVKALGECGLDYFRNYSSPSAQEYCFQAQLELAVELQMPLFLHQRDAHGDFFRLLNRYLHNLPKVVVHCFTGQGDELAAYIEAGLYVGITGWICDERRGLHLRDLVGQIPLNRLMIETDAPYLTPRTMSTKRHRNEPAYLTYVLTTIAECLGLPEEEVAQHTANNARRFFGI